MEKKKDQTVITPKAKITTPYSINNVLSVGRTITNSFKLDKDTKKLYEQVLQYFRGDPEFEKDGFSLNKGLLLTGDLGTGKSTVLKVIQILTPPDDKNGFGITPTRLIAREYSVNGVDILNKYGCHSFHKGVMGGLDKTRPINRCFDDLGLEDTNSQNYGNYANVMADIILDRYDSFISYGMLTHATTNLGGSDLEREYGDRVRDRLKEMMNFIVVRGESKRR